MRLVRRVSWWWWFGGERREGGLTASVAAGEGFESVHEFSTAAAVGVLADVGGEHDPFFIEVAAD